MAAAGVGGGLWPDGPDHDRARVADGLILQLADPDLIRWMTGMMQAQPGPPDGTGSILVDRCAGP
ncbi:MAG: hypothetical protein R3C32_13115 [Chloroflexota bacterium]